MTGPTQVNRCKHRQVQGAKGADRLQPKWHAVRRLASQRATARTSKTAGVETGAKSSALFEWNMVNPISLLLMRKADRKES